jgi:nucleotide-binding universal stress UspA family protein
MKPSLIVHPASFSPRGKTALATAIAVARSCGADFHVLEVRGRRRSSHDPIARPITDVEVEPHFAEFVQSVNSADVKISAVELVGDIVDAVAAYARSASADLVVVSDQARSHGPYWRRGMYANDLARRLSIPLLTVSASLDTAPVRGVPFTKILCPIDLSSSSMTAIEHALSLATQSGAQVVFLHVDETLPPEAGFSEETKSRAEAIARAIAQSKLGDDVKRETIVRPGVVGEVIVKTAAEIGADLIVVTRPRTHDRVSLNSRLSAVLRKGPCSVLILPAAAGDQVRVPLEASGVFEAMPSH